MSNRSGARADTALDRFWKKVDTSGGPSACWNWLAGRFDDGGGAFNSGMADQPVVSRAQRFAYELLVGPLHESLILVRICETVGCVNPGHYVPCTAAEAVDVKARLQGKVDEPVPA